MLADGIHPTGDGLLEVAEERLRGLLVQDDINEIYEVEQTPFARGKFAAVRRAIHKKSGVHFAAKFLKRRRRAQSSDKEIKHEIAVLMLCAGSDNIVKLNAVHETRSDTALLLELATGGELQTFLDNEGSLTEAQTRICMKEILKAIQFLHKRSIAHLDLKPQNILLTGSNIEDGLKLCDFGISRVIENGSKVREILGTPDYVAPEVLQYEPLSLQTDIWSVGVLTYVLLSGYTPFGGDTKQETFLNISQCSLSFPEDLFQGVSQYAIDFIKSTLRIKPNERMSAFECLEHIWLKDESPVSRTSLNISAASDDVFNKQGAHGKTSSTIINKSNGCQSFKQGIDAKNGDISKHTSSTQSSDDNDEYDKENFLSNSPATSAVGNLCYYTHSDSNEIEILHKNLEKNSSRSIITTCASSNSSSSSSSTKVSLCLFPDAPTTPKVIRKAPSESPTSVKALVKKFQLENGEPLSPVQLKENHHHEDKVVSEEKSGGVKFITRSNLSSNRSDTFKNCVFCLSCAGPGCRHSGSSVVNNKSSSSLGLDQGIIC